MIPLVLEPGKQESRFFGDTVFLVHEGDDGRLVYTWELPASPKDPPFGIIRLQADRKGVEPGTTPGIPVARDAKLEWTGEVGQSRSRWEPAGEGRYTMHRAFQIDGKIVNLKINGRLAGKSLVLEILCDQPAVSRCLAGEWGSPEFRFEPPPPEPKKKEAEEKKEGEEEKKEGEADETKEGGAVEEKKPEPPVPARRSWTPEQIATFMRRIDVPFLTVQPRAFLGPKLFTSAMSDWRISNESSRGQYAELSDGTRNPLVARFIYTASWNFPEVLPNIPHPPSPWREDMGARTVFEIDLDNPYEVAQGYLDFLTARGMDDYTLILREWQFKGPDAMLPTHFPAKGKEEQLEALEELGKNCEKLGMRLALQEEYSDMWPDYEKYSERYLSLGADGKPATGYRNARAKEEVNQQAYIIKPELMAKFAAGEAKDIHRGYNTSASYLHRHSSNPVSRGIDYSAGAPGAGMARHVFVETTKLFAELREQHEGPVLGLGGAHWNYAGFLDGAFAQSGAGWKARGGKGLPLLVDFNLLRIHPLQINYGMGPLLSWIPAGDPDNNGQQPWGGGTPMVVTDQYRMQQVIFGHASYVGTPYTEDEGMHWLEQGLVLPVTRAHSAAKVSGIDYFVGGEWVDTAEALWAQDLNAVRVRYDNGLEIYANQAEAPLNAGDVEIPQYGWLARAEGGTGSSLLAYTGLRDGAVIDYAKSADGIFVNARRLEDWREAKRFGGYGEERGTELDWQAKNLNDGIDPIDFGEIKTDGSVRLRKEDSTWVLTAFPRTSEFTVLLKTSVFKAPRQVESKDGAEKTVDVESVEGGVWWKIPLNGATSYRFPASR